MIDRVYCKKSFFNKWCDESYIRWKTGFWYECVFSTSYTLVKSCDGVDYRISITDFNTFFLNKEDYREMILNNILTN